MNSDAGKLALERVPIDAFASVKTHGPTLRKQFTSKCLLFHSRKVHPRNLTIPWTEENQFLAEKNENPLKTGWRLKPVLLQLLLGGIVCHCMAWHVWLLLLNFAPNDIVNGAMHTTQFDDGSFWLLLTAPPGLVMLTTCGLSLIIALYIVILVDIVRAEPTKQRQIKVHNSLIKIDSVREKLEQVLENSSSSRKGSRVVIGTVKLAAALADNKSRARQIFKLWMKAGDLVIELVLLRQLLKAGSPVIFIVIFAGITASNALSCVAMMFLPFKHTMIAETLVDIMFDLLVAVEYPVFVVFYWLSSYGLNRAQFAINLEVFPPGSFERAAKIAADPVQTAIIDLSVRSLRIMTVLDLVTRMVVSLMLCFRLHYASKLIHTNERRQECVYPRRHYPASIFFVAFALFVIVFVYESIRTSTLVCSPHPECAMIARRWTILEKGSLTQCPCLILVDREIAPTTYAEWLQPRNVTEKVAQLATMGELQGLLLTNRHLPVLPDELRRCTKMKQLSLEYTHTQTLPDWIKEYNKLEFLHIENKLSSPMTTIPDKMFRHMTQLTFIHFSTFTTMTQLPSFTGLKNLKSLTLSTFPELEELPSFGNLYNLERLVISLTPMLHTLPDFAHINNLKTFTAVNGGDWCCNGFLGDCDLANPLCQPHSMWNSPPATCLAANRTENVATPATILAVKNLSSTTCGSILRPETFDGPLTAERVNSCNGTLWKQCNVPGAPEAMCYNARFRVIACTSNPLPIKMRRLQIERAVGDPCDPKLEAWLGCSSST